MGCINGRESLWVSNGHQKNCRELASAVLRGTTNICDNADDIIVIVNSHEELLSNVRLVLKRPKKHIRTVNPEYSLSACPRLTV